MRRTTTVTDHALDLPAPAEPARAVSGKGRYCLPEPPPAPYAPRLCVCQGCDPDGSPACLPPLPDRTTHPYPVIGERLPARRRLRDQHTLLLITGPFTTPFDFRPAAQAGHLLQLTTPAHLHGDL
ncbi:hypothetical protein ACWEO1_34075 [Kitasatospora cineracea]